MSTRAPVEGISRVPARSGWVVGSMPRALPVPVPVPVWVLMRGVSQ